MWHYWLAFARYLPVAIVMALWGVPRGALAQSPTESMLDVRLAAQEYVEAEEQEVAEKTQDGVVLNTKLTLLVLEAHRQKADTAVKDYIEARQRVTNAITHDREILQDSIYKVSKTTSQPGQKRQLELQQELLQLRTQVINCQAEGAPATDAEPKFIKAWYKKQTQALQPLLKSISSAKAKVASAKDATAPVGIKKESPAANPSEPDHSKHDSTKTDTSKPASSDSTASQAAESDKVTPESSPQFVITLPRDTTELKKAIAGVKVDLSDCPGQEENETVVLVRGLGQGLFTGTRLVPAVTVLADAAHFQPSTHSALIGGLELVGLSGAALKQIDSTAVRQNYLLPEVSTFGANLTVGVCKHGITDHDYKRAFVGLLWRGSYLRKNLTDTAATDPDKRRVGTDHLMSNLTMEFVVPQWNLSFFAGYTYQEAVGQRAEFKRLMGTNITSLSYFNWGVRGRLSLGQSKGRANRQNINVEVGFIQLNDRLRTFLGIDDVLQPVVRVGFNHRIFDNLENYRSRP